MRIRWFAWVALAAAGLVTGAGRAAGQNPREAVVPVGVTASSTQTESKSPQKLIDGWGLAEPAADGAWCHSGNAFRYQGIERGSMWSFATSRSNTQAAGSYRRRR